MPPYYLSNTEVKTEQILVLFWISTNLLSKGMQAVKLCTNKILQFLTKRCQLTKVDLYNGHKTVVVVLLLIEK